jgi:hypothetical protein
MLPNPEFDLLLKSVTELVGQKQSIEVPERKIIPLKDEQKKKELKSQKKY